MHAANGRGGMAADETGWLEFAGHLLSLAGMDPRRPSDERVAKAVTSISPHRVPRIRAMMAAARALREAGHAGPVAVGPDAALALLRELAAHPSRGPAVRASLSGLPPPPAAAPPPAPPGPGGDPEAGWCDYARNLLRVARLDPLSPTDEEIAAGAARASPYPPGRIVVMLRAARLLRELGIAGQVACGPDAVVDLGARLREDPDLAWTAASELGVVADPWFAPHKPPVPPPRRRAVARPAAAPDPSPVPLGSDALADLASRVAAAVAAGSRAFPSSGVHPADAADPRAWALAYARAGREGRLDSWREANLPPRRRPRPGRSFPALAALRPPESVPKAAEPAAAPRPVASAGPVALTLGEAEMALAMLVDRRAVDARSAAATFLRLAEAERIGSLARATLALGCVECLSLSGDARGAALVASDWALPTGLGPAGIMALAACCPATRPACVESLVGHPAWGVVRRFPAGPMPFYDAAYLLRPLRETFGDAGRRPLAVALAALSPQGEGA